MQMYVYMFDLCTIIIIIIQFDNIKQSISSHDCLTTSKHDTGSNGEA